MNRQGTLLDMRMGTGKSRVVVDLVSTYETCVAVILCPKSVVDVWPAEFRKWFPGKVGTVGVPQEDVTIVSVGNMTKSWTSSQKAAEFERIMALRPLPRRVVLVANYETAIADGFLKTLHNRVWSVAVLDESHRVKAPTGVTSKHIAKIMAKKRLCLTGTPLPHSPLDVFAQARFVDRRVFGPYWTLFKKRYAVMGVALPPGLSLEARQKLEALGTNKKVHAVQLLKTQKFKSWRRQAIRDRLVDWLHNNGPPLQEADWSRLGRVETAKLMDVVGFQHMDELREKMRSFTFQVRTEDVLNLPECQHVRRLVTLGKRSRKAYQDMEHSFVSWVRQGVAVTAQNALVRVGKLQQITSGFLILPDEEEQDDALADFQDSFAKALRGFMDEHSLSAFTAGSLSYRREDLDVQDVAEEGRLLESSSGALAAVIGTEKRDALADILEDLGPDEPVVVFGHFRVDLDMIQEAAEAAGRECYELSGRRRQLDQWKKATREIDPAPVIAVQMQSGGVGISLVEARYCIYYSMGFSLGDYVQSLARLHRPGQEREVTYFHLVAEDTIDVRVYGALQKRQKVIDSVLDGLSEGITTP